MIKLNVKYTLLIGIGIVEDSDYIGTSLSRIIQEVKSEYKPYSTSSKKYYIDQYGRTAHWVGHLLLKYLYYNYFFERKHMVEDLEADLTGAPIDSLNTEYLEVAEETNPDEAITAVAKASNDMEIDLKEERNKESYI